MVQVDVFWSYAFGAGYAMAAHRQIKKEYDENPKVADERQWYTPSYVKSLLFISILFAPSGIYLLWAFPDWETMQVAIDHHSLPPWLVTLFAATNVTQGILGYWVTRYLITRKDSYKAFLNFIFSYFGFFFILVHGWDGTGYQRFFSVNRQEFLTWGERPWHAWLTGEVALTLYGMGVILLPVVYLQCGNLIREGMALIPERERLRQQLPGRGLIILGFNSAVFVCGLFFAIASSVLIHLLGWALGILASAALIYLAGIKGVFLWHHRILEWQRKDETPSAGRVPSPVAP